MVTVLVSRDGIQDQEIALAKGFEAMGCKTILRPIRHQEQFLNAVIKEGVDLSVHRCYTDLPFNGIQILKRKRHKCKYVFWEKGWPRFLPLNKRSDFDVCFTACNDGTAVLLPQASEDHRHLRKNTRFGLTLVGANKFKSKPAWGNVRPTLHARLRKDLGNPFRDGLYNIHSKINPYSKRFAVMANSWASIGIWNVESGVPLRHFEIISCGTPLICYPFPELRNHFVPGKHYIETENMRTAVEYYQAHPSELADIAEAGYQHFLANHTYKNRAKQILNTFQRWRKL